MNNQLKKLALVATAVTLPVSAMAAQIDPTALTGGINDAAAVIIAVATAIFGLVGLLVAITYSKRAAK